MVVWWSSECFVVEWESLNQWDEHYDTTCTSLLRQSLRCCAGAAKFIMVRLVCDWPRSSHFLDLLRHRRDRWCRVSEFHRMVEPCPIDQPIDGLATLFERSVRSQSIIIPSCVPEFPADFHWSNRVNNPSLSFGSTYIVGWSAVGFCCIGPSTLPSASSHVTQPAHPFAIDASLETLCIIKKVSIILSGSVFHASNDVRVTKTVLISKRPSTERPSIIPVGWVVKVQSLNAAW